MRALIVIATMVVGFMMLTDCAGEQCPPPNTVVVRPIGSQEFPSDDEQTTETDAAAWSPCRRACFNLKQLGCPEANRIEGGASCTATCNKLTDSGVSSFDPTCINKSKTQDEVRTCNVRCGSK